MGKTDASLPRLHGEIARQQQFLGKPIDISPHQAMMDELRRSAAAVSWFEGRIREIGTENEDQALHQFTKMGILPSNWMALYQWERKHVVEVAATCIKAGIAERQVRLAEQHGQLLAMALMSFMNDDELGLTPAQQIQAPAVMRRILLALPSGTGKDAVEGYEGTRPTPEYQPIEVNYTDRNN